MTSKQPLQKSKKKALRKKVVPKRSPEVENDALITMQQMEMMVSAFSGPIPPPTVLAKYAEIDPTLPDRIIAMAEKE